MELQLRHLVFGLSASLALHAAAAELMQPDLSAGAEGAGDGGLMISLAAAGTPGTPGEAAPQEAANVTEDPAPPEESVKPVEEIAEETPDPPLPTPPEPAVEETPQSAEPLQTAEVVPKQAEPIAPQKTDRPEVPGEPTWLAELPPTRPEDLQPPRQPEARETAQSARLPPTAKRRPRRGATAAVAVRAAAAVPRKAPGGWPACPTAISRNS